MGVVGSRTPVVVGVGLSDGPVAPHLDAVQHHVVAMRRALEDSGVRKADIDGYCCAGASKSSADPDDLAAMAEYLGIDHRWLDGTMVGGSSFEFFAQHAAAAIRDGQCDTVLMTYGSDLLSRRAARSGPGASLGSRRGCPGRAQYEAPYGNVARSAPTPWPRSATCTSTARPPSSWPRSRWASASIAALNPNALYRGPDHGRRRALVAHDRRSAAQARLLRDLRRRWGCGHDHRRARPRPAPATGLRPRCRRRPDPLEHQPDARLHDHGRRGGRGGGVPPGRASRPATSTLSSSTTASRSPCCCCSRTSASAPRARAGASSRAATCGSAASCR